MIAFAFVGVVLALLSAVPLVPSWLGHSPQRRLTAEDNKACSALFGLGVVLVLLGVLLP